MAFANKAQNYKFRSTPRLDNHVNTSFRVDDLYSMLEDDEASGGGEKETPMQAVQTEKSKAIVVSRVKNYAGSVQAAEHWYDHHRIPGFGLTPAQLVERGYVDALNEHIDSLEADAYA